MSDPLALVPLAAAARGGLVDMLDARQLVGAGITLLQRCAPLVRVLALRRAAILLPNSADFLLALAACDGRGALLLDPASPPSETAQRLAAANVGAVLTLASLERLLPDNMARVVLDLAPGHATFINGAERRVVDLGSHVGFPLEGESDVEGRDEEAVLLPTTDPGGFTTLSHRELLAIARAVASDTGLTEHDHSLATLPFAHPVGLTASLMAPLLMGAHVTTMADFSAAEALEAIERTGITFVAGDQTMYEALISAIEGRARTLDAPALRVSLWGNGPAPADLSARWLAASGIALQSMPS
ncbi:MAG TPA: AMP-binding protein [Gemmatimonadaceae bacterium]